MRIMVIVIMALAAFSLLAGIGGLTAFMIAPEARYENYDIAWAAAIQIAVSLCLLVGAGAYFANASGVMRAMRLGLPLLGLFTLSIAALLAGKEITAELLVSVFLFQVLPVFVLAIILHKHISSLSPGSDA
jgi:hypothetical protein